MKNNKNILSIDGGGIRGVAVLPQLEYLETQLKSPITNHFNYIAANSTGGIIGVLLAIGYSVKEIKQFYLEHGEKIFNKQPLKWGLFEPEYDVDYFEYIIKKKVSNLRLSDVNINLIVPATNYSEKYSNKLVHIFKSSKAKADPNYDYSLFDVVRATTSAQTYFRPHIINNEIFIDGGMCINSPSMVAFYEAQDDNKFDSNPGNINVISFSTGQKIPSAEKQLKERKKALKGGKLEWAAETVDLLLSAQQHMVDYFMNKNNDYGLCNYQRIKTYLNFSDGSIDNASKENMNNMLIDGADSAIKNKLLIQNFIEKIK